MNEINNLLTANKVAQQLDISVTTLGNWYKWYKNPNYKKPETTPTLPDYIQSGKQNKRFWKPEDMSMLQEFKEWIPKGRGGVMGDQNASYWGQRGVRALTNKTKIKENEDGKKEN